MALLALPLMWALLGFDISEPRLAGRQLSTEYGEHWSLAGDVINPISSLKLPGGIYIGSFLEGYNHGLDGHPTFLLGEISDFAPWYHHPVVATYKVPLGVAVVLALGLTSLAWARPRAAELPLLIAAGAWGAFILSSGLGIGFRHFLPVYIFLLMMAVRCLQGSSWRGQAVVLAVAWLSVGVAAIDVLRWHPNYLSYINWPRDREYLDISDSNVDWGQGLKQVGRWLEAHPQDRLVTVIPFNRNDDLIVSHYVGPDVRVQGPGPLPEGVLIISKALVPGAYTQFGNNRLGEAEPMAEIGESMLVYDLDALRAAGLDP